MKIDFDEFYGETTDSKQSYFVVNDGNNNNNIERNINNDSMNEKMEDVNEPNNNMKDGNNNNNNNIELNNNMNDGNNNDNSDVVATESTSLHYKIYYSNSGRRTMTRGWDTFIHPIMAKNQIMYEKLKKETTENGIELISLD